MKGLGAFGTIGVSGQGDEKVDYIQLQKILCARCRVLGKEIMKSRRLLAANQLMKSKIVKNIENIIPLPLPLSMVDGVPRNADVEVEVDAGILVIDANSTVVLSDENIISNGSSSIREDIPSEVTNGHKILHTDVIKEESNEEKESKEITVKTNFTSNEILETSVISIKFKKEEEKEVTEDLNDEKNEISSHAEKIQKVDTIFMSVSANQNSPFVATETLQTTLTAPLESYTPSISLGDSSLSGTFTPGLVPMNVPIPRCVDLSLALLWQDIASQALLIPDNYQQKETFDSLDQLLRDAGRFFSCDLGESDSRWQEFLNLQKVENHSFYSYFILFLYNILIQQTYFCIMSCFVTPCFRNYFYYIMIPFIITIISNFDHTMIILLFFNNSYRLVFF